MIPRALAALALTLAAELPVLVVPARLAGWASGRVAVAGAVAVNVLTQPLLFAASTAFGSPGRLLAAEAVVVAVETALLRWAWRVRGRQGVVTLACAVLAANATSTALGLLVL
ncbi:hypothetical protein [Terrabacter sp. NPDC000476]|uniref:hypothetical protein n=1 Tax=Terrabacter sp. NPDC000476 TaxID=3154258 RepID=UPI00332E4E2B